MEVVANIKSLDSLKFIRVDNNYMLEYHKLLSFLQNFKTTDEQDIVNSNIQRELRNYKEGIIENDGRKLISAASVIKLLIKHSDKYLVCNRVLNEIVTCIFEKKTADKKATTSTLDLYKQIANFEFCCEDQLNFIAVEEKSSLYKDYKDYFSDSEWKKICYFEFHFAKCTKKTLDFEKEIKAKQQYLHNIRSSKLIAESSRLKCEELIQENQFRIQASEEINGINFVHNNSIHSFKNVDKTLNDCIKEYVSEHLECISLRCSKVSCDHPGDIHVFIEAENFEHNEISALNDVASLLQCEVLKKHNLSATVFLFVQHGTFQKYICKQCYPGNIHRFELQNELLKKTQDFVLRVVHLPELDYNEPLLLNHDTGQNLCDTCFGNIALWASNPLDWRSIDVTKEWLLQVPLEIQQFFSTWFLNKNSIRKSPNPSVLLNNKLTRLYALLDAGLNLYNRNYQGLIQQLNSQELVVNYHSLETVFNITSHSGCTSSLRTADRWLKSAADPNTSYFETYLKHYPLHYKSLYENDKSTHYVCLQDCFLVFFMYNLFILTTHEDPDPGNSRTSQICTLPITLKGLPKDHEIVDSWHEDGCTERSDCKCMETKVLEKKDSILLLQKTEDELQAWKCFQTQVTWGLLKAAVEKGAVSELLDADHENCTSDVLIDLDSSMQSLHINASADTEQRIEDNRPTNVSRTDSNFAETNQLTAIEELEAEFDKSLDLDISIEEQQFFQEINDLHFSENEPYEENTLKSDQTALVDTQEVIQHLLPEFQVPPLLCRHPIPATGRDDDITNIRHVLSETLQKLDKKMDAKDRILFAPDHKISQNVLKLMKENPKFNQFLPEFPALHLRKSKIVNLFAAYQKAGLQHLLKFMKDSEQENDWQKLLTLQNIETATQNITRLSSALHLAAVQHFCSTLSQTEEEEFLTDVNTMTVEDLYKKWGNQYENFMKSGSAKNAIFALHCDLMKHCDEIVAISVAERIGGKSGYHLLLASVKNSLPFAFLNGSSSYAAFCVELLHEHYRAGTFHQNMKMTLYSTPHKDGSTNVALDTQREMDHKEAIKGFRPRSTLESVVPRMAIVDHFVEVHSAREKITNQKSELNSTTSDEGVEKKYNTESNEEVYIQFTLGEKDWKHITPVCLLLKRLNAFNLEECLIPRNIYDSKEPMLPCEILDSTSYEVGQFLIKKYAANNNLFGMDVNDIPAKEEIRGPSVLVKKATGKSTTLRRISAVRNTMDTTTESEIAEKKRQAKVKRQTKVIDCLSSSMNTCQSLVNPDSSKTCVQKSAGVKKALLKLISSFSTEEKVPDMILAGEHKLTVAVRKSITHATVEFAGIKFRSKASSGQEYLKHIENGIFQKLINMFPNLATVIVCEEKYSYTPDDLKSATRKKRQKSEQASIAHLKCGDDIISDRKLSKSAVIQTGEGKQMISNYLARNLSKLEISKTIEIIVDSELITVDDECDQLSYTLPLKASFGSAGFIKQEVMDNVHQRKGEAEMAQVDWLGSIQTEMHDDTSVISIVTSGDIDSVIIHLFALSLHWPRHTDGSFKNHVYVLLQKTNTEIYKITEMIEYLESRLGFRYAALNIAVICLMGGNDFIPKLNGMPHEKWMSLFLTDRNALKTVLTIEYEAGNGKPVKAAVNKHVYFDIIKKLYCPKALYPEQLSLDEVRQISVRMPGKKDFRHPTSWMPPESALECIFKLINCQIEYLFTAWNHTSVLPDFMGSGCLIKDSAGEVRYNFGNQCSIQQAEDLLSIDETFLQGKLRHMKSSCKRRVPDYTPEKHIIHKRRPIMSTPVKMKERRNDIKKSLRLSETDNS